MQVRIGRQPIEVTIGGGINSVSGVGEAPQDATPYVRQDAAWLSLTASAGSSVASSVEGQSPPGGDGDATTAIKNAFAAASNTKQVFIPKTYFYSADLILPVGYRLFGPGTLKKINAVSTTTTQVIATGTGTRTFTVTSSTGFAEGMSVMFALVDGTVRPNDAFNHTSPVITAISGNTITIATNSNFAGAVPSGATMQTTSRGLICSGNNVVEGTTFDGNGANQTHSFWTATSELIVDGSNVRLRDLTLVDTSNDAILAAGPQAGVISGVWMDDLNFSNVGNNGIHLGNIRDVFITNPKVDGANMRVGLAENLGGGGVTGRLGHQDGGISFSDNIERVTITGGTIKNAICGVGGISAMDAALLPPGSADNQILIAGTHFIDCRQDIEVGAASERVQIRNTMHTTAWPLAGRWTVHHILYIDQSAPAGASGTMRTRKITMEGFNALNGTITAIETDGLVAQGSIDNRAITDVAAAVAVGMQQGVYVANSKNVELDVEVEGGIFGYRFQSGYTAATRQMRNIHVKPRAHGQRNAAFADAAIAAGAELKMVVGPGGYIRDGASSIASWVGLNMLASGDIKLVDVPISNTVGNAHLGASRRVQNKRGNLVNGVFEQDHTFTAYSSGTHTIVAGTNTTSTDLGAGVWEVTKTGGIDGNADAVAHMATNDYIGDADWDIYVEPQASTKLCLFGAVDFYSAPDAMQSDGFDFGLNLFSDGVIYHASHVNAANAAIGTTTGSTWIGGDKIRIGQRGGVVSYRKNGADFDAATVIYTLPDTFGNSGKFKLRLNPRSNLAVYRTRAYG